MAWKGMYATTRLYATLTDELKDLDPYNKGAMATARIVDDMRLGLIPSQVTHKCTGGVDKVAHGLGQKPDHVAIGYMMVLTTEGGHGGVKIISYDDTNVELEGTPDTEIRILSYRGTKYI
ncbi:hypothetical protein [Haliangium sp. UPWRP_2]|uniref:hypothetical protein n=1 Tax=Haliangium sp. UPWRP_2 TaxID=1931276 RepID=UPI000D0D587E|nr:hypothetical protein [Haliangium sp. UPWRP_2]PSM31690.1 hypothetical protein BVG81_004115 [Haliangium sp. UPWRP_2]